MGAYAPVVSAVVVVTANHWVFDAVTGAAVAAVAALAAQTVFARVRPQAWAWEPEPAPFRPRRAPDRLLAMATVELHGRDYQTEFRNRLIESRLTPNAISLTGFVLCVVSAVLILQGWWIAGGIAFIVGSVCDTLDGRYSRMSGKGSPFGAFLDSTLDRLEEGIVLAAVAYQFSQGPRSRVDRGNDVAVGVVVLAVLASLMVSYTRARAEALGVECKVGIADRAVRVVVLSAGLVFGDLKAIEPAVYLLAAMAIITVFQRIFHVRSELRKPVTEAALAGVY